MNISELQQQLFQQVKTKLPGDSPLVETVADVLEVSTDSAYRRIRGEKTMSLEETYKLCMKFQISLDNIMNVNSNAVVFTGNFIETSNFKFKDYLTNVMMQVKYMNNFENRHMTYSCKDIPLFHHFHFREIAAFKYYFWMKNILHFPEFAHKKFRMDDYPEEFFDLGRSALNYYNQLDTTEIWNIESLNSTIRQVEFYHDSNTFSNPKEILEIYIALGKLIDHLEAQATAGYKFNWEDPERKKLGDYQMYFNEIIILENSMLVSLNGTRTAFLVHNVLNVLMTRDVAFCENMNRYILNLIKKSTLISSVSERERFRFFKNLRNRIENRKQNLKI
jgi:hypothetical protein